MTAAAKPYATPLIGKAAQRSQLLADMLRENVTGANHIQSGGELAARLGAQAILSHKKGGADDELRDAQAQQRASQIAGALAGLEGLGGQPDAMPPLPATTPGIAPQQPGAPAPGTQVPAGPTAALTPPSRFSPQDRDGLTRMLFGEALGEGDAGMTAAGSVAMNRLNKGYGGAKTLADVINQPKQFEAMNRPDVRGLQPTDPRYLKAQAIADALLGGKAQDPTGGAMNFINPDLQAKLGRSQPSWAPQGQGQRIGNHVFYGGTGQPSPQALSEGLVPPPPQAAPTPPMQPFQVASNGPPPMPAGPTSAMPQQPSPAPPVPGVGGAPPAAASPVAGGSPSRVTPQEIALAKQWLEDPATFEKGQAFAQELQQRNASAVKYDTGNINGVPYWSDPQHPGQIVMGSVPQAAMSHNVNAQDLGINAPPGVVMGVKPTGETSQVWAPEAGYQAGGGGKQSFIPGGRADPAAGQNLVQGEAELRKEYDNKIATYRTAREGYQKVIQAAGDPTQAGAIAMVFGVMKTLDPTSTVREGEQAQVQNSGTIPETVTNIYNKLITGTGSLTPRQRAEFANTARKQFEVYQKSADALNERYGGIAKSNSYNPDRIVQKFDPIEPYKAPPEPAATAPAGANRQAELQALIAERDRRRKAGK